MIPFESLPTNHAWYFLPKIVNSKWLEMEVGNGEVYWLLMGTWSAMGASTLVFFYFFWNKWKEFIAEEVTPP